MERVDSASDDRTTNNAVRHQYRVLDQLEKDGMVAVKDAGLSFLDTLDELEKGGGLSLASTARLGREFALARTKIEEAVMWAVKGITK